VSKLSSEQKELVETTSGRFLVEARPGCGKTTTIAHRVAALSKGRPDGAPGTLCLTHSRAAVAAMTGYTEQIAGAIRPPTLIATFHSFAESVLRSYGHLIGLRAFTLLDTDEARVTALRMALEGEGVQVIHTDHNLLASISAYLRRSNLESPAIQANLTFDEVVKVYVDFLEATQSVDFDLLLIKANEVLSANPSARNHYRRMYGHIIVDEAQDTSSLQLDLLAQIIGPKTQSVEMFIDADQRVNGWLGVPDGLPKLLAEMFELETRTLSENFRNHNGILAVADAIRNGSPIPYESGVEFPVAPLDNAEGILVADWIRAFGTDSSIAVIARSRWLLTHVESALTSAGISFWNPSEKHNLFSTEEFQHLLPILRWLASPDNLVTRRELAAALQAGEESDVEAVTNGYARLFPRARTISACLSSPKNIALSALEYAVRSTLDNSLETDDDTAQAFDDDLRRVADRLRTYRLRSISADMDWAAIYQALTEPVPRPSNSVWVGSIHAAKGLEFDAVAVVGLTEGGLPDFRSKSETQLREERRLFYVAVTRARSRLIITRCQQRVAKSGRPYAVQPSRFLGPTGEA
jgi:DNA helicase II / ATP-dependent DNA helicase PcrA